MSVASKLAESVENGLQIIEFIQKNRDTIQETHGRSAIQTPSSKARIQAWEAFIEEAANSDTRPERGEGGQKDNRDEPNQNNQTSDTDKSRDLPSAGNKVSKPVRGRGNSSRNDNDLNISTADKQADSGSEFGHSDRGGRSELERDVQHESGSGDPTHAAGGGSKDDSGEGGLTNPESGSEAPKRLTVKEMTKDDLDQIMEETKPVPVKRVKNISSIAELRDDIFTESSPVKKTTEESTLSIPSMVKLSSGAGATQYALESPQSPEWKSVSAENAQRDVLSANTTMTDDDQTTFSDLGTGDTITVKLEEILYNQKKILDQLVTLNVIKEELNGIKKVMTNHSVAISTLENYMSQLMIVIPKSGIDTDQASKEINPDLRMVIGRDNTRGRAEITKKYDQKDKILVNEDIYVVPEVDEKFILKEIDNTKNNASNFIPTTDLVSVQIIKDIIDVEVQDPVLKDQLLDLVDSGMNSIPTREIYNMIRKILDDIQP